MKTNKKILFPFFLLLLFVFIAVYFLTANNKKQDLETTKYEQVVTAMKQFANRYCLQHNMEFLEYGNFTGESPGTILFGIWLRSYANEGFPEARARAISLVTDFYSMLENEPSTQEYLTKVSQIPSKIKKDTLRTGLVGVKVAYWDEDVNRPLAPYIAEMSFHDDTFFYYEADPKTQALRLVYSETYDEAYSTA